MSAHPYWRDVTTVGVRSAYGPGDSGHRAECACEACGPAVLLLLSEYEATRLREALETRNGADTGDWHGQIRNKLAVALAGERLGE